MSAKVVLSPGDPVWFMRLPKYENSNMTILPAVVVKLRAEDVRLDVYVGRGRVKRRNATLEEVMRRDVSIPGVIEDCGTPELFLGSKNAYTARKSALPDTLTDVQWRHCQEYFGYRCAYCYGSGGLVKEHYIPVSCPDCPGTIATNIVPACARCNNSKGSIMPNVWLNRHPFVQQRIERYFEIVRRAQKKPRDDQQLTLFA